MGDVWRAHDGSQHREEDAFGLAPIATLSAALSAVAGDVDGAIAPELMEGAMAHDPARREAGYDQYTAASVAADAYPAAAQERDERWSDFIGEEAARQSWTEGYPDNGSAAAAAEAAAAAAVAAVGYSQADLQQESHDQFAAPRNGMESHAHTHDQPSDSADPSDPTTGAKRKRKPAKRPAESPIPLAQQETEYSHPSRDPRMGPVFVHPPKDAAQACVRCHRIKRKCDAGRPRCKGCEKADEPCVFELSPATSGFVHELKASNSELSSQIAAARERIQHLELTIASMQHTSAHESLQRSGPSAGATKSHPQQEASSADILRALMATGTGTSGHSVSQAEVTYPPRSLVKSATDACFRWMEDSYPVITKSAMGARISKLYGNSETPVSLSPRSDFLVLMATAIGLVCSPGGAEDGFSGPNVKDIAMRHFAEAVGPQDLISVQNLTMLALYSLLDSSDISPWASAGAACRMAISANLHLSEDESFSPTDNLFVRTSVFEAVYNLDRLVSSTLRRPLNIPDAAVTIVDQAAKTPRAADGESTSALRRYTLGIRTISGQILSSLYYGSGSAVVGTTISGFEQELAGWRSTIRADWRDDKRAWAQLQYHAVMILLHSPSPKGLQLGSESTSKLFDSASAYLSVIGDQDDVHGSDIMWTAQLLTAACAYLYTVLSDDRTRRLVNHDNLLRILDLIDQRGQSVPHQARLREVYNRLASKAAGLYDLTGPLPSGLLVDKQDSPDMRTESARSSMRDLYVGIGDGLFGAVVEQVA